MLSRMATPTARACLVSASVLTERRCITFHKLMERVGVMSALDVSGQWLASVVMVVQATVGQLDWQTPWAT